MPVKNLFGRRKSTATPFEDGPEEPVVEPSFKVFERGDVGSKSFDGGLKFAKSATAPPSAHGNNVRSKISYLENDNMFENVMKNRGSGASNTNTASTTDDSSRLSAASTAPSSTDISHRDDWKSGKEKSLDIKIPPIPKSTSAFSMKNAGRTLSWGRHKHPSMSPKEPKESKEPNSPLIDDEQSGRARAATASSYASTAIPLKLDHNNDLALSLGGDFGEMFGGFGKRKSVVMDAEVNRSMSNSPESLPTGPARTYQANSRLMAPSPLSFDRSKEVEPSPYSWSSQHSREGLMSSISPPPFAGRDTPPPPPVPKHASARIIDEPQSYSKTQRPESGLRRSSALSSKRQSTLEYGDAPDEDARLLRETQSASRQLSSPKQASRVRDSWALPSDKVQATPASSWKYGSADSTPKAKRIEPVVHEDNMFDASFKVSANVAQLYEETGSVKSFSNNQTPKVPSTKVMTPAQFERYKQDQERMRSVGGRSKDDQDDDEENTYEDEEDDAEKAKAASKIRRKQEAHMAVYRQQMMKVTGESSAPRPSMYASQSSPNLSHGGGAEDPEEDEEVPLAILQAHGFPNKGKQPAIRSMGSNPNLRAAGSISGGVLPAGHLPVFARGLPQDPYYGAGLVTPAHRESMAFSVAESAHGGPSRGLPPGGLVGVIVSEERSRAMRRGSPNPDGTYGQAPGNGYNGMGMQPPPGSMYGGMGPQMPMGQMPPMMMTPGDAAQIQMSQQMSQFMQMQMQFMQMMTSGQQPPNGHTPHASMEAPRAGSVYGGQGLRPGSSSHQRAMTMMEPNAAPWMQQGGLFAPSVHAQGNGYAPSIAPSERSNVGLPGRYRPVSQAPMANHTTNMSNVIPSWDNKNAPTIKMVKTTGNASDDDDDEEEGWAEMAKQRAKKQSIWSRGKKGKDTADLKDIYNYGL